MSPTAKHYPHRKKTIFSAWPGTLLVWTYKVCVPGKPEWLVTLPIPRDLCSVYVMLFLLGSRSFWCICAHVGVCAGSCACVYMHMWRSEGNFRLCSSCTVNLLSWARISPWPGTHQVNQVRKCLRDLSAVGITSACHHAWHFSFLVGSGDWTEFFMLARWTLSQLSCLPSPSLFLCILFFLVLGKADAS